MPRGPQIKSAGFFRTADQIRSSRGGLHHLQELQAVGLAHGVVAGGICSAPMAVGQLAVWAQGERARSDRRRGAGPCRIPVSPACTGFFLLWNKPEMRGPGLTVRSAGESQLGWRCLARHGARAGSGGLGGLGIRSGRRAHGSFGHSEPIGSPPRTSRTTESNNCDPP